MGMGKISRGIPARVESVRRRLERWREMRRAPARIPEPLWDAAVRVAGRVGVHRTAKALRLDYYSLKRRVEQNEAAGKRKVGTAKRRAGKANVEIAGAPAAPTPARFVELPVVAWSNCGECILELERSGGAKIRVYLKGMPASDVAAIGRGLWRGEP